MLTLATSQDTKIEYREAQILRRREQARKRKAIESEFEALDQEIQEGKDIDLVKLKPMMVRAKVRLSSIPRLLLTCSSNIYGIGEQSMLSILWIRRS